MNRISTPWELVPLVGAGIVIVLSLFLVGCTDSDADVVAKNISKAAEQFEVNRRIVFFNGITDKYLLVIEGRCSVESFGTSESGIESALEVTCKVDNNNYRKSYLGLSDNVSYFVEQLGDIDVSENHYRVIFKPEVVVPNFDRP